MNTKIKKISITLSSALGALLLVTTATYAIGTLTPSGTAGDDTQYSLNDIYSKLVDFTDTPTVTSSPFATPGTVEATFRTLSEIYELLEAEEDDLVAENIADGVTVFGVEGTAELASELEWSTEQGPMNWDTAVSTCAGTVDGSTGWRLPKIGELINGLAGQYIENPATHSGFVSLTEYWSGTGADSDNAWIAGISGSVENYYDNKINDLKFRCVR
jgi:hypothetical protein